MARCKARCNRSRQARRRRSRPPRVSTAAARIPFRAAKAAVDRSRQMATADRRAKKRKFPRLWIQRINAASANMA